MSKIAYEPHPVTPERKQFLREKGYTIIDARFAPDDYEYPDELKKRVTKPAEPAAKS